MTQNIEKFYGFKAALDDDLTPVEESALRLVAERLADIYRLDTQRYFVYFHHLKLLADSSHFGFRGGIEDRVEWLVLDFNVNLKQVRNNSIRFFNSLIDGDLLPEYRTKNIIPSYSDFAVSFQIPGSFFKSVNYFRSAIITFVDRDRIKPDRRKIKATVTVIPSLSYANRIRSDRRVPHTKIDVRFKKDVQLRLPLDQEEKEMRDNTNDDPRSSLVYNFHVQQAGAVGPGSQAHNFQQNLKQDAVLPELITLLTAIAQEPSRSVDIELLRLAASARTPDEAKGYLAKTSSWVLDKAEKIGVPLAVQLIKDAIEGKI